MKPLTKREKFILLAAGVTLGIVTVKLKDDVFKAGRAYNALANKLCSGGIWTATDITPRGFNLVRIMKLN